MNQRLKVLVLLILSLYYTKDIAATHVVGGEISYAFHGGDLYTITLKIYRDCKPGGADFDKPAYVGIFSDKSGLYTTLKLPLTQVRDISPPTIENCLILPPNICVEEGLYSLKVNLPDSSTGYTIVYQRCCRNSTIANLNNPLYQGATYSGHIPKRDSSGIENSSPVFKNLPPTILCFGKPIKFDHAAIDADGDSLVYELCAPLNGVKPMNSRPNPPSPPPYPSVEYEFPYHAYSPLSSSPVLAIDSKTGILTGTPTMLGQFVVGICVQEWRNGQLIGNHSRDFQFNIADCKPAIEAKIHFNNDTILNCDYFNHTFLNLSQRASHYFWDFGDLKSFDDTANTTIASYMYKEPGFYDVTLIADPGSPCSDTDRIVVGIFPGFEVDFDATPLCSKNPSVFTDKSKSTHGSLNSWEWSFGNGELSQFQHPHYIYPLGGEYEVSLLVRNSVGCRKEISKLIQIPHTPTPTIDTARYCLPQPQVLAISEKTPKASPVLYNWEFSNEDRHEGLSIQTRYFTPGYHDFNIHAISSYGCEDSLKSTLKINPPPSVNASKSQTIYIYDFVELKTEASAEIVKYAWFPNHYLHKNSENSDPNIKVQPLKPTTYTVTVTDDAGCKSSDQVTISLIEGHAELPTAFTPNGDGKNDFFAFIKFKEIGLQSFMIYNRWGQKIFSTQNINKGWDGTYNGEPQPIGTYTYVAVLQSLLHGGTQIITGNITLLR